MKSELLNLTLSYWSIYLQIMIEVILFILFFIGWFITKKRIIKLWTIAWGFNVLSLFFVFFATNLSILNIKPFLDFNYEIYGALKIAFVLLLLFSILLYDEGKKLIKFPLHFFLTIELGFFIICLNLEKVDIQLFVYGIVSIIFALSTLISFFKLNCRGKIFIALGFFINTLVFLHHFIILILKKGSDYIPFYMSRISFYDGISEFVLALSFLFSIIARNIEELQNVNEKLIENQEKLRSLIDYDPLTGLRNRRSLRKFIEELEDKESIIVFIDVDKFKILNDKYGHRFGDACLLEISKTIRKYFRPDDGLFRYGGDEFLLVLPQISKNDVEERIKKIKNELKKSKMGITLSFSCGISQFKGGENFEKALLLSDKRMYEDKKK